MRLVRGFPFIKFSWSGCKSILDMYIIILLLQTFFEFQRALWFARDMNLYTRSGLFRSLASEHNSL